MLVPVITKQCCEPTVLQDRYRRNYNSLHMHHTRSSAFLSHQRCQEALTTKVQAPAMAHPIRCWSQWIPPESQNEDWSTSLELVDGQETILEVQHSGQVNQEGQVWAKLKQQRCGCHCLVERTMVSTSRKMDYDLGLNHSSMIQWLLDIGC